MNRILRYLYIPFATLTVLLFLQIAYYTAIMPDNFFREENTETIFGVKAYPAVSARPAEDALPASKTGESRMTLMLYGIIPIKDVTVSRTAAPQLIPSGEAFGLKMLTDGVMVTQYGSVDGIYGIRCPAKEAGIKTGDVIISANGRKLCSSQELSDAVQLDSERTLLTVVRDEKEITINVKPERSKTDGTCKLGIWTRDSCAGIGTMTYRDPLNKSFGSLGHSVCDSDTGSLLPLSSGETVPVCIDRVVKGVNGCPGELCGTFMSASPSGSIELNTDCGVFGFCGDISDGQTVPMAFKQDVEIGEAAILATINGMTPQEFDIVIEKVNYNSDSAVKNMVIRITDPELLSLTGGIVQGMSGSPIIQNGKLVGAVTHVFVNDVTRGYAIFAENMYSISSSLSEETSDRLAA